MASARTLANRVLPNTVRQTRKCHAVRMPRSRVRGTAMNAVPTRKIRSAGISAIASTFLGMALAASPAIATSIAVHHSARPILATLTIKEDSARRGIADRVARTEPSAAIRCNAAVSIAQVGTAYRRLLDLNGVNSTVGGGVATAHCTAIRTSEPHSATRVVLTRTCGIAKF